MTGLEAQKFVLGRRQDAKIRHGSSRAGEPSSFRVVAGDGMEWPPARSQQGAWKNAAAALGAAKEAALTAEEEVVLARHPAARLATDTYAGLSTFRVRSGPVAFDARLSPKAAWAIAAKSVQAEG